MKASDTQLKKLPDTPGVYFFLGKRREVLYIGKATSLRNRVKSYFVKDIEMVRSPVIRKMVDEARSIDVRETDSVLEALILEASLIKTHKPRYNSRDKDDKSYNYVVITKEDFPRVLVVRGKELDQKFPPKSIACVFGPFPQGGMLKEALRLVRRIFPFRDSCLPASARGGQAHTPLEERRTGGAKLRGCFNAQIGLCPGVCTGAIGKHEYQKTIARIKLFFDGKKKTLVQALEKDMRAYAKKREFEHAARVKRTLFALQHINDVTLLKRDVRELPRGQGIFRIEAYDVAHISGADMVGVMTVVENGEVKKTDYRKFRIKKVEKANDTAALEEILRRRFVHDEWRLPNLIVVDGGKAQQNTASRVLKEFGYEIPVVSVIKDERHRARQVLGFPRRGSGAGILRGCEDDIVLANSEAHRFAVGYHRARRRRALR